MLMFNIIGIHDDLIITINAEDMDLHLFGNNFKRLGYICTEDNKYYIPFQAVRYIRADDEVSDEGSFKVPKWWYKGTAQEDI